MAGVAPRRARLVECRVTDIDALLRHAAAALSRTGDRVSAGSAAGGRRHAEDADLSRTRTARHAVSDFVRLVSESGVRTRHRRHFGWMNASAHPAAWAADLLVSGLNPQLAARALSPGPVSAEARLVREVGDQLGLAHEGHFTSGGSEANATALVCAMTAGIPGFVENGVRGPARRVYASVDAHDSLDKAVRAHGLGQAALRRIPVDEGRAIDMRALGRAIREDREAGHVPLMIVSTAGTTNVGALDPLQACGALAKREGLWHHVDAAWGGMLAFTSRRAALAGLEAADSVTFDPHKALGSPLGTGMVFVRPGVLGAVFDARPAYGPDSSAPDPYARSLAWSRRFVGGRLWLPLLLEGWPACRQRAERRRALGADLREAVRGAGYIVDGPRSELPVVCFRDPSLADAQQHAVADRVTGSGAAWIAKTRLDGRPCLRACVCSDETDLDDIAALGQALAAARVTGRAEA